MPQTSSCIYLVVSAVTHAVTNIQVFQVHAVHQLGAHVVIQYVAVNNELVVNVWDEAVALNTQYNKAQALAQAKSALGALSR